MNSANRVAQVLAAFVGVAGLYFTIITLITVRGAVEAKAVLLVIVSLPMLIVGVSLMVFSYRAVFSPTEKSSRHIAAVYSIITLLYSGVLIEPLISRNEVAVNPKVVASGSSIVLAVIVYYGLKALLKKESQKRAQE